MDEFPDLYDDSPVGTDNAGDTVSSEAESDTSGSDNGSDSGNAENPDSGIPDSGSDVDNSADGTETENGTDGKNIGTDDLTGTETDGENSGITGADGTGDSDGTENGDGSGLENTGDGTESGGDEIPEGEDVNTEILTEINDALHTHTGNVQAFFTDTVSGNAVTVTPDDSTAALFTQGIENQTLDIQTQFEILDRLDTLNGSVMLLFVVLAFDLLHRFAKRIIRNLMKGDAKNGTDI